MFDYLKSIPVTFTISIVTLILYAVPSLAATMEFHTSVDFHDQVLQTLGCHLLHWTTEHLFWDLSMFVILGAICERFNRTTYVVSLIASAALIPPIAAFFHPAIETYRGLSGIDSALFGLAVVTMGLESLRKGDRTGSLIQFGLLAAMVFKIGHELLTGNTLFVASDSFAPVPVAHIVGVIVGIFAALFTLHPCDPSTAKTLSTKQQKSFHRLDSPAIVVSNVQSLPEYE